MVSQSFSLDRDTYGLRSILLELLWHKAIPIRWYPKESNFLQLQRNFQQPLLQVSQTARKIKLLGKRSQKHSLLFSISYDSSVLTKNLIQSINLFVGLQ